MTITHAHRPDVVGRLTVAITVVAVVAATSLASAADATAAEQPVRPVAAMSTDDPSWLADPRCAADPHCAVPGSEPYFTDFFAYLSSIPRDVLERGDAATQRWADANPAPDSLQEKRGFRPRTNLLACVGSLALAVGTLMLPAAKILRIRVLLEKVGGVVKAARGLVTKKPAPAPGRHRATRTPEPTRVTVGDALVALGSELLGVAGIASNCFGAELPGTGR